MKQNKITLNEHIDYKWSEINDLDSLDWLDADIQIIDYLKSKFI